MGDEETFVQRIIVCRGRVEINLTRSGAKLFVDIVKTQKGIDDELFSDFFDSQTVTTDHLVSLIFSMNIFEMDIVSAAMIGTIDVYYYMEFLKFFERLKKASNVMKKIMSAAENAEMMTSEDYSTIAEEFLSGTPITDSLIPSRDFMCDPAMDPFDLRGMIRRCQEEGME